MVLVAAGLAEMNFLPKSYRVVMGLIPVTLRTEFISVSSDALYSIAS